MKRCGQISSSGGDPGQVFRATKPKGGRDDDLLEVARPKTANRYSNALNHVKMSDELLVGGANESMGLQYLLEDQSTDQLNAQQSKASLASSIMQIEGEARTSRQGSNGRQSQDTPRKEEEQLQSRRISQSYVDGRHQKWLEGEIQIANKQSPVEDCWISKYEDLNAKSSSLAGGSRTVPGLVHATRDLNPQLKANLRQSSFQSGGTGEIGEIVEISDINDEEEEIIDFDKIEIEKNQFHETLNKRKKEQENVENPYKILDEINNTNRSSMDKAIRMGS